MRYLLDTHVLLWARSGPDKLSREGIAILESPESELNVSVATLWECAIKLSIGKLELPTNFYRNCRARLHAAGHGRLTL